MQVEVDYYTPMITHQHIGAVGDVDGPAMQHINADTTRMTEERALCGAPLLGIQDEKLPRCPVCVEKWVDMFHEVPE